MKDNFLIQIPASTPPDKDGQYFVLKDELKHIATFDSKNKIWFINGYNGAMRIDFWLRPATEAELLEAMKEHLKKSYEQGRTASFSSNSEICFKDSDSWFTEYINSLKK